jgi:hypothetical protein
MSVSTAFCSRCQRLLYLGQNDARFCPVCSSPVVATAPGDRNAYLQERLAKNEVSFRSFNEAIERSATGNGHHRANFMCECTNEDCSEGVELTLAEYERVRRDHSRFLVVLGHEDERVEIIVDRNGTYSIVEKTGKARRVVEGTDPRT